MQKNQVYVNGIITNTGTRLERYRVHASITFIKELLTLALLLAVTVALAVVLQPL